MMIYTQVGEQLFSKRYLSEVLQGHDAELHRRIDEIDEDELLGTSTDDWCDYFCSEFFIHPIEIREKGITTKQNEIDIDVSNDQGRYIRDSSRPFYIKGLSVQYFLPYEGERELLRLRPSRVSLPAPTVSIQSNELVFEYRLIDPDITQIKSQFERDLSNLRETVDTIANELRPANEGIREKAKGKLEDRRTKLLANQNLAANLGFPLRERENAPKTYVAPQVRRKAASKPRTRTASQYAPEPILEMNEYEHTLDVIQNMVSVMERSPQAFSNMAEENLRQHFLVQLNGKYEGQATGETFNYEGKTDILIRVEDRNIFIAECKFWRGPKGLTETIDQILGYLSWRDTKAAILLFSRNKNTTTVLEKIPSVVSDHPNYKRRMEYEHESGFRFTLFQTGDVNREVTLTILVFDVPE